MNNSQDTKNSQSKQEPVAWMDEDGDVLSASVVSGKGLRNIPLYTTPPKRKPLTDEEMQSIAFESADALSAVFVAEAKLKQKNTD